MEKIHINIEPPRSLNEYEKKQYELLCNDEFVKEYLQENSMTYDDLQKNLPLFVLMVNGFKECERCGGLDTCPKSERGYQSILKKGYFVDFAKKPCKYLLKEREFKKKESMYLFKPFTKNQMNITLDTMKVFNEDSNYVAAFESITDYLLNPHGKGIYLFGNVGVGKTYLMIALCNEFVSQGKTVAFINVSEFLAEHKTRINYDLIEQVKNADFCVFDDIGQESVTSLYRDEILFPILNERMQEQRMTCFTSNFDFKHLQEHFEVNIYNDKEEMKALRIMERIRSLSVEVKMVGESRR